MVCGHFIVVTRACHIDGTTCCHLQLGQHPAASGAKGIKSFRAYTVRTNSPIVASRQNTLPACCLSFSRFLETCCLDFCRLSPRQSACTGTVSGFMFPSSQTDPTTGATGNTDTASSIRIAMPPRLTFAVNGACATASSMLPKKKAATKSSALLAG